MHPLHHIINTHTHTHTHTNQVKTLRMDFSWDHFNSRLQAKTHNCPQKQQLGYVGFQEKFNTPPLKPTKTESSFRKLNSPLAKLHIFFSCSALGQGVYIHTEPTPVIASRMDPTYTYSSYRKVTFLQ